jgi:hypothetical protein
MLAQAIHRKACSSRIAPAVWIFIDRLLMACGTRHLNKYADIVTAIIIAFITTLGQNQSAWQKIYHAL